MQKALLLFSISLGLTLSSYAQIGEVPLLEKAGTWTIQKAESMLTFKIKNMWLNQVEGTFSDLSGTVTIGPELAESTVDLTLNPGVLSTGITKRDEHIKGEDFFDIVKFPTVSYAGTSMTFTGDETYPFTLRGNLTIRGITLPIEVPFSYTESDKTLTFTGKTQVAKDGFGLDDWKGVGVGDEAEVRFTLVVKP